MKQARISVTVNGGVYVRVVESRLPLVDFLRDSLGLTGTHIGCEQGACGACTVLVNDTIARSCLMLAVQADGCDVRTVESLGSPDNMHPLQTAFAETRALQCGFCTPGLLMTAIALLRENPSPTPVEVREAISGHLCRCTGYATIVAAILNAAASGGAAP